jgi:hypothetical protein
MEIRVGGRNGTRQSQKSGGFVAAHAKEDAQLEVDVNLTSNMRRFLLRMR